jgi:hypothetical protein
VTAVIVVVRGVFVLGNVKPSPPVAICAGLMPFTNWAFRPDTRFELLTFSGAAFPGASSLSGVPLLLFRYDVVVSELVCPRMKFPPFAARDARPAQDEGCGQPERGQRTQRSHGAQAVSAPPQRGHRGLLDFHVVPIHRGV